MRDRFHPLHLLTGLLFLVFFPLLGAALAQPPAAADPPKPLVNGTDDPLLHDFVYRSIGPANMGGRIDDIAVVEKNPSTFYVGFATGGVWKTVNNGTTFEPIFETYRTASIGDIAVDQTDSKIIWVGTGEANNRQSSSVGDGIYKSMDGGKSFTNMGLKETQTIARIVIDPHDDNIVYVAALGHLFGPNSERGIYKTSDGGKSWSKIKYIDEDTGFTDMVIDPVDPKILYAASFQRRRTPWGFNGGGPGSGIWKTTDAGHSWTRLKGGLPTGSLGRIGLSIYQGDPRVVYAQIEVTRRGGGRGRRPRFGRQETGPPDPKRNGVWRSDDRGRTWQLMSNNNNRPMYYSQIRVDPSDDQIIYTCGSTFYKSTDGGKKFEPVRGIAHSDHHAVWIDPNNSNHLIIGNDGGLDVSYDRAATWEFINTIAVSQLYAVSVDMRKPYYVYGGLQDNGSWGAPSRTRSRNGITNADWFRIGSGDGFYVQVDPTDHNTIYVESQNGNIRRLDLKTGVTTPIRPRSARRPPPQSPGTDQRGGPPRGFGGFGRFGAPATSNIVPEPPPGERYRYNWNMPIQISPHNPRTIYVGGNRFFRSMNRGDAWMASRDLTKEIARDTLSIMGVPGDQPMMSKNDGTSTYGNITTLAESPVQPGILWVGTDDGNVQVSRDGGFNWTNVAGNITGITGNHQISRVEPSHFDSDTCYVSIDGHRNDDLTPYLFVTTDLGATWKSLSGGLPIGNVNVIREDPKNKKLLYAGTEFGLFISQDGGAHWRRFMNGLPTVRVDDLLVHPRENDLVVGTHGRGVYILDDVSPLQQLTEEVLTSEVHLFDVRPGTLWLQDVTLSRTLGGAKHFRGSNPPAGTAVHYYLKSEAAGDVKITVSDITGKVVRELKGSKEAGINRVQWDLRHSPPPRPEGAPRRRFGFRRRPRLGPPAEPGVYLVKLSVDGKELTGSIRVEEDTIR